jgi:predicted metalloprotease
MYDTPSSSTTTMESKGPSLTRSLPDDSSRSYSSIESCWSEELSNSHYRQQQKTLSTGRIKFDYNGNNNSEDTDIRCPRTGLRLTRSHSCPTRSSLEQQQRQQEHEHELLKNDLYIPPSNKDDDAYLRHKKNRRKHKRERKTAAGAVGGMVAGGVILGPIGVVLGAALGGFTIRQIAKKADKLSQRRREQKSVRDFATSKSIQWTMNGDSVIFT